MRTHRPTNARHHAQQRVDEPVAVQLELWTVAMRAEGMSERTITDRVRLVSRINRLYGHPAARTTAELSAFIAGRRTVATRSTYFYGLRAYYQWLKKTGRRSVDPTSPMVPPRAPRGLPRPIATQYLDTLLAANMLPQVRTMILLAAYQGLRVHEIAKIRGEDVDVVRGTLHVAGKGGTLVDAPLHPVVARESLRYPVRGPWFPSKLQPSRPVGYKWVSRAISEAMVAAGVPGTAHSLRHWFGTELMRSGASARVVQELLRHASLGTVELYTLVAAQDCATAILSLPGSGGAVPMQRALT